MEKLKYILKDVWSEFVKTVRMLFWVLIFLSIFLPFSTAYWTL